MISSLLEFTWKFLEAVPEWFYRYYVYLKIYIYIYIFVEMISYIWTGFNSYIKNNIWPPGVCWRLSEAIQVLVHMTSNDFFVVGISILPLKNLYILIYMKACILEGDP